MNKHTLIGGQVLSNVHDKSQCLGQYCTIHNFSDHHMVDWPQNWRSDRGIMERICMHGIGHPDPDDPKTKDPYESVHGCDGCCVGNEGHAVMYNLETLHHPYAGDAMDYIEKLSSLLKNFYSWAQHKKEQGCSYPDVECSCGLDQLTKDYHEIAYNS